MQHAFACSGTKSEAMTSYVGNLPGLALWVGGWDDYMHEYR